MVANPHVKSQCFNYRNGMLSVLFFHLDLVTAAASDPRGSTVGKYFSKLHVQTGLPLL